MLQADAVTDEAAFGILALPRTTKAYNSAELNDQTRPNR